CAAAPAVAGAVGEVLVDPRRLPRGPWRSWRSAATTGQPPIPWKPSWSALQSVRTTPPLPLGFLFAKEPGRGVRVVYGERSGPGGCRHSHGERGERAGQREPEAQRTTDEACRSTRRSAPRAHGSSEHPLRSLAAA